MANQYWRLQASRSTHSKKLSESLEQSYWSESFTSPQISNVHQRWCESLCHGPLIALNYWWLPIQWKRRLWLRSERSLSKGFGINDQFDSLSMICACSRGSLSPSSYLTEWFKCCKKQLFVERISFANCWPIKNGAVSLSPRNKQHAWGKDTRLCNYLEWAEQLWICMGFSPSSLAATTPCPIETASTSQVNTACKTSWEFIQLTGNRSSMNLAMLKQAQLSAWNQT